MKDDRPSATALLVARGVAFQSTHPRHSHLVDPQAAELTRRFVKSRSGASAFDRAVVAFQERITVPGITLHHVLRKRRIEQLVRAAIGEGYTQLIVLGGGLDTLAIRIAGEITAIEIDHPATQRLKRSGAGDTGVEFLAVDFTRERLEDALARSSRYRPGERTLFLAEAVFMYLTEAEVRDLFRQLPPKARIIFTFMEPYGNFRDATWLADLWLKWMAEPPRWGIDPSSIEQFLSEERFRFVELARDQDYHGGYKAARGEHIAVAERT
jgi:methyltransferase (TIGR00027 family)